MKKSIFIVPIIIILAVYLGFTFWAINAAPEKPAYIVEEAYGATSNGAEFYTVNLSRIPTGSTEQLLGSYEVENTIYTFDPEKGIVRIMKDSSYDIGDGTIQIDNEKYTITKNGTNYTLKSGTKTLP
ncbi:MAG: hypothetical protein K5644_00005, partial [Lachnospiraceae bacterium]|nr:hypothetical protein [Lachnospiraceae bacterium]